MCLESKYFILKFAKVLKRHILKCFCIIAMPYKTPLNSNMICGRYVTQVFNTDKTSLKQFSIFKHCPINMH